MGGRENADVGGLDFAYSEQAYATRDHDSDELNLPDTAII